MITLVPGDGVGPELAAAVKHVFRCGAVALPEQPVEEEEKKEEERKKERKKKRI
jgi:isocitrate/isopropylmalate dehydrogenase